MSDRPVGLPGCIGAMLVLASIMAVADLVRRGRARLAECLGR